jgi:hypothetical protein
VTWKLGFQPQLGHPWFELVSGVPVYLPPSFFWWWYAYDAYAPHISPALTMAQNQNAAAIIVAANPLTTANSHVIIERCLSLKLPAMDTFAFETKNGALMSYGIDLVENYRRTAEYII